MRKNLNCWRELIWLLNIRRNLFVFFISLLIFYIFNETLLILFFLKFVAHSNCQQKLDEIWNTGVRDISKLNKTYFTFFIILLILLLPIFCVFYIFTSTSKVRLLLKMNYFKIICWTKKTFSFQSLWANHLLNLFLILHLIWFLLD